MHSAGAAPRRPSSGRVGGPRSSLPTQSAIRISNEALESIPSRLTLATRARSSGDRKSTRLNSSHVAISYAVFCLKKKKKKKKHYHNLNKNTTRVAQQL